ncbi:MAG: glycosyl transferase family 9 [Firmicutes bacterium]|nr:glycosyl transferase family 9 [Bacillota bacterium]
MGKKLGGFERVLIIRLSAIGDVIQASPVAQALKKFFPHSRISWVVETKSKDVVEGNSNLQHVFVWPRKEWEAEAKKTGNVYKLIKRNWNFITKIRQQRFDIVIDLQGMYRSDFISYFSGAKHRICLPNPPEPCVGANIYTPNRAFSTVYERYLSVLLHFGIEEAQPILEMPLTAAAEIYSRYFMINHGLQARNFIIFNPSTSWPSKCWALENFAKLGDMLAAEFKMPIVVFGDKSDKYMAQAISMQMNNPIIDATGSMTLKELGAVAKQAGIFISGDTGPLYIAQALQVPTVALFGVTSAMYYQRNLPNQIALQGKENSIGNLTVNEVLQAVRLILTKKKLDPLSMKNDKEKYLFLRSFQSRKRLH